MVNINTMAAGRAETSGADGDDYWNASQASTKPGFNMFDDAVGLSAAKNYLSQHHIDDFGDDDTITLEGTAAASRAEFKSARTHTSSVVSQEAASTKRPTSSFNVQPGTFYQQRGEKPSQIAPTSIQDAVKRDYPERQQTPTVTEVSKLESEIRRLRRLLDAAQNGEQIPTKDAIRKLIRGQPCSLEMYKSKKDKLTLLADAIDSHDGNVIIMVILFLKSTIKTQIFNNEVIQHPRAAEHYVNYLRQHGDTETLMDVLTMLGRNEEAALLKYRLAVAVVNPEAKVKALKHCYSTHFQLCQSLSYETSLLSEQISLIERQLPIEAADSKEAERGVAKFVEIPRSAQLTDTSVISTLYYCCLYHYDLPENHFASPVDIRKRHALSEKQFVWIAIKARGRLRRWKDIDELFITKGWLGGTKMKAIIGFDKVVGLLSKMKAPRDVMNSYCKLIEPAEQRLKTGQKYGCHETVIETLVYMRDRLELLSYQSQLTPSSQEWFYCNDKLKNSSIKWKN